MNEKNDLRTCAERLAREAVEERFKCRLATEDQRNGYEVGWAEGYIAARSSGWEDAKREAFEEAAKKADARAETLRLANERGPRAEHRQRQGEAELLAYTIRNLAKSLPSIGEPQ